MKQDKSAKDIRTIDSRYHIYGRIGKGNYLLPLAESTTKSGISWHVSSRVEFVESTSPKDCPSHRVLCKALN
jgi:hypothetical protein